MDETQILATAYASETYAEAAQATPADDATPCADLVWGDNKMLPLMRGARAAARPRAARSLHHARAFWVEGTTFARTACAARWPAG